MEATGRLFLCHHCRTQVVVCSRCDRGQIYCAEAARRASLQAAGRRYQKSRNGRLKHAERNRRYRLRQQNVTHQGSMPPAPDDLLLADSAVGPEPAAVGSTTPSRTLRCHFCGMRCSGLLRQGFVGSCRVPSAVSPDRSLPFPTTRQQTVALWFVPAARRARCALAKLKALAVGAWRRRGTCW